MATSSLSDYATGGGGSATGLSASDDTPNSKSYLSHSRLKQQYLDYLGTKREEISEQQDSRRMVHGSQWTNEQIQQLNLRRQPVVFNNKIKRKINGVIGTIIRLKQDPKGYARTPQHEQGADLATEVLRYITDEQNWDSKDPEAAWYAAVDGIGGIEINIIKGDRGDPEIEIATINPDGFFYDPRSYKSDFEDARYMGIGKWMDVDTAIEMFPDKEQQLRNSSEVGSELSSNSDRDARWFQSVGNVKQIRIIDHWYKKDGNWLYCIYTGNDKLMEGKSYLQDEKDASECKYIMFSAYVDQDGDRYGFIRDFKPLQLEINMRRSKALYTMLSRRILAEHGAFDDVEKARREAARADGVVLYNKGFETNFDDTARMAETEAQFKFLEDVKSDLESFGPNIAVTGEGLEQSSGRAIHLLQQAGLADLGPFLQAYRGWKIRVYRSLWNAAQRHWTGERWIRVTDDDDLSQFIQINGVGVDPRTGLPTLVNNLGALDVDIILDEGPDTVNQMADAYDTLTVLAKSGTQIPPDILIELSPLPASYKKRLLQKLNPQPTPEQQQRTQIETQMGIETVRDKAASAEMKHAQAVKALAEANVAGQDEGPNQPQMQQPDHPMKIFSDAQQKIADAGKKKAETAKIVQDIQLEPQRMALEQQDKAIERAQNQAQFEATRQQTEQDSERNYEVKKMQARRKPSPAKSS